jgi:hypothetical protein
MMAHQDLPCLGRALRRPAPDSWRGGAHGVFNLDGKRWLTLLGVRRLKQKTNSSGQGFSPRPVGSATWPATAGSVRNLHGPVIRYSINWLRPTKTGPISRGEAMADGTVAHRALHQS